MLFPDPSSKTGFAEYYRELGALRKAREILLMVCAARHLSLSENDKERIAACEDSDVLGKWLGNAATATTPDEIFAEQSATPQ
ncbi:hypothetical protein [Streptomyces sp. 891-h]|uniref:hypothetical protein n=1 Tax=unclassified Streptomyces TaxID=2593676 RepID=UPI001FA9F8DD|nr:hypothetical protein [Streptomyces sp. 891-h]UNZ17540.1 hypothetical protein HC362_11200 [Streptomyces sp. 891-h]